MDYATARATEGTVWVTAWLASSAYDNLPAGTVGLSHRALVGTITGSVRRVGCSKAKPGSILPDSSQYTQDPPTCPICAKGRRETPNKRI